MFLNKLLRAQMKVVSKSMQMKNLGAAASMLRKFLNKVPKKAVAAKTVRRSRVVSKKTNPSKAHSQSRQPLQSFGLNQGVPDFVKDLLSQLGVSPITETTKTPVKAKKPVAPKSEKSAPSPQSDVADGRFLNKSFSNAVGALTYKLYIPSSYDRKAAQPMPLMVMLHGCTQHPDDFAQGTRMNLVAEERQCVVLYPAQTASANPMRCWNWFNVAHQQRDKGEPALIAGVTREVIETYQLDAKKVYVAGLSAGGAMAVIMGATYPELYAAVGVHSGMPYAAAKDVQSAFSAMKNGASASRRNVGGTKLSSIPIIVFHGDKDQTVNPVNGSQLIPQEPSLSVLFEEGQVDGGHRYTRTSYHSDDAPVHAEHWVIHGAGHAWAGGSTEGTYADPAGPDASREMMRFFYTQTADA